MLGLLVPVALAATLTTNIPKNTPQQPPSYYLTRVLPEQNFVAYHTQPHDSLKNIAVLYYDDASYWTTLWNDNATIKNPEDLSEGITLSIRTVKPDKPAELTPELQARVPKPQPQHSFQAASIVAVPSVQASMTAYEDIYKAAGGKFGVPWQILYGIHMTETGGRDGHIVSRFGNGPEGPMQFMPGTFAAYAVDGDGDGVANIDNATDAIYTAANYLSRHGSLMTGLYSYGGNTQGTLSYARAQGFNL